MRMQPYSTASLYLGNPVIQRRALFPVRELYGSMQADNSLNCRAALVGSPHLAHAEPRRVFEFLNYSLCDGMLPVAYSPVGITRVIECVPKRSDICAKIQWMTKPLRTFPTRSRNKLASLERRPPEGDTNECRPKFLIDKVQISVTLDSILDYHWFSNRTGSFRRTPT